MATVEYPGNAIPGAAYAAGAQSVDEELLYSTVGYVQKGVTLKPGQGVLLRGTFLKQDASTKKYVKTATAGDVEGVLRKTVDTGTTVDAQVWMANILYGGVLKLALVSEANSGVTLTNVLSAQVNEVQGFFKF